MDQKKVARLYLRKLSDKNAISYEHLRNNGYQIICQYEAFEYCKSNLGLRIIAKLQM